MLEKTTKIVVFVACLINVFLLGLHLGFDLGLDENSSFTISGITGYQLLARCYIYICVLLLIFIVGKLIKKHTFSRFICLISLILIIFPYQTLYLQKRIYFNNPETVTNILLVAIPFDLIGFLLFLSLLIFQIIITLNQFLGENK